MSQSPYALRHRTPLQEHPYTTTTTTKTNKQNINNKSPTRQSTTNKKASHHGKETKSLSPTRSKSQKRLKAPNHDMQISQVPGLIMRFALEQIRQITINIVQHISLISIAVLLAVACYTGAHLNWSGQPVSTSES